MTLTDIVKAVGGLLFHDVVLGATVLVGVLLTVWTGFGQWRALTHGIAVVRGKYDEGDDPGAVNHFQALSAALSATVGLGNIAGVAIAVAVGGPGAVLWMWVIGFVGMALKMTEVTQSMLYRVTDDPANPHGGPMFVVRRGLGELGGPWKVVGAILGGVFSAAAIVSAFMGGNMFQAWNVGQVTALYFNVPTIATGVVLAVLVGAVILGGIRRIGSVAGAIVPLMCVVYLGAAAYVLAVNAGEIPGLLWLIVRSGLPSFLGGAEVAPTQAFLGAGFGMAVIWGMKRALFSSEVAQGSAPMAHSAARTHEPVREGIVAGLEPFIDTIVVCTLTALVILSSGAWNRGPEAFFPASATATLSAEGDELRVATPPLPARTVESRRTSQLGPGTGWSELDKIFLVVRHGDGTLSRLRGGVQEQEGGQWVATWEPLTAPGKSGQELLDGAAVMTDGQGRVGVYVDYTGAALTAHAFDRVTPGLGKWLVVLAAWLFAFSTMVSWSYYGETGVSFLFGDRWVLTYRVVYCVFIAVSTVPGLIKTDVALDAFTTLGTGLMLVINLPIIVMFARSTMRAYHGYLRRLDAGEFDTVK